MKNTSASKHTLIKPNNTSTSHEQQTVKANNLQALFARSTQLRIYIHLRINNPFAEIKVNSHIRGTETQVCEFIFIACFGQLSVQTSWTGVELALSSFDWDYFTAPQERCRFWTGKSELSKAIPLPFFPRTSLKSTHSRASTLTPGSGRAIGRTINPKSTATLHKTASVRAGPGELPHCPPPEIQPGFTPANTPVAGSKRLALNAGSKRTHWLAQPCPK